MTSRGPSLATMADLPAVVGLTVAAYQPYTDLLGAPPLPVTEDYAPRIARGQVWLLNAGGRLAGLLVIEHHPDHALILSVAVAPELQGQGHGVALLRLAEALAAKAGLAETGRRPNPHRPGWTVVDMAKTLPPALPPRPKNEILG